MTRRQARSFLLWTTAAVTGSACGCIVGNGPSEAKEPAAAAIGDNARVQRSWQQKMLDQLQSGAPSSTEAWGLFSSGGWADAGQVMVFTTNGGAPQVQVVAPAKKVAEPPRPLSAGEFASLTDEARAADKLGDLDLKMFDGIVYEYVHAVRGADGKALVAQRVRDPQSGYDAAAGLRCPHRRFQEAGRGQAL